MADKKTAATEPSVATNEFTLLGPHTHDGKKRAKGDKVLLSPAQAQLLRKLKLIAEDQI